MIQIKKTILTLVALLAVTTGAWADETPLLTIESQYYSDFTSGSKTFDNKVTVTFSNSVANDGDSWGWYSSGTESLLTVAGTNGYTITSCKFYTESGTAMTGYTVEGESPSVYLSGGTVFPDDSKSVNIGTYGITKIEVYDTPAPAAPSGPEVAWDKATKTGTFTMPGGNVTLEPEYYPQATVADGGVTAADADARATTDDPLVKVDATKLTGAKKLMYFVSNSGTTAPAYDAEGWTDQLPTAESLTQQGIVYVWYYPVGTDEGVDGATATYSDGDICLQSITARIAPEPTYAVTFAEGTDPNEWKADPATGVTKGQTVTVTYTGTKKVIGVKAEKKEKAPALKTLANATAEDLGKIAGADGNIYDTKAAAEAAGTTAVAMIAYVGSDTGNDTYTHGMALALSDEGEMNWSNAKSTCEGKSAVSGAAWLLPSRNQWKAMFKANGGNEGSYTGLNTAVATAGGDSSKLQKNERYWSSSEQGSNFAWVLVLGEDNAGWDGAPEDLGHHVRACLAF